MKVGGSVSGCSIVRCRGDGGGLYSLRGFILLSVDSLASNGHCGVRFLLFLPNMDLVRNNEDYSQISLWDLKDGSLKEADL